MFRVRRGGEEGSGRLQAFLVGIVFAALFLLGVLTVWMQSEAFDVGYRIEAMQREADALRRESDRLRTYLAVRTTPSSLLEIDPTSATDTDAHEVTLMPEWNVVWFTGSDEGDFAMRHASRGEVDNFVEKRSYAPAESFATEGGDAFN